MLPVVVLAVLITLVAIASGVVVWLILSGLLDPETATIGASIVLIASSLMLSSIVLRAKARRAEREERTVRRSQLIREREPLRYDLDDEPAASDEPDLVHPMPSPPPASETVEPSTLAVDETALWLEPVVLMPSNETVGWRALPGDRSAAIPSPASLDGETRARAELRVVESALPMTRRLDEPLLCPVSQELLSDGDAALELRRMVDADPAQATRLVLVADLDTLDSLAGGRLDDLIETGMGLAITGVDLTSLERSTIASLVRRGASLVLLPAGTLDIATAARPVRWLAEAGIEPVAIDVPDENAMLRIADLSIVRFAGPAFGAPRRARERVGEEEPRADDASERATMPRQASPFAEG